MAKELERLVLRIEADTKRLRGELRLAEGAARQTGTRMSRAFARASRGLAGLTRKIGSTRTAFIALAGVTALGFAIKRAIDFTEQIGKQADAIGLSTDKLQQYRFAADLAGVEQDTLDKSLRKASRTFGELGRTSSELDLALKDLAPTLLADLRAADSFEEQLALTLKALSEIEGQTKKNTISNTVFGRSGVLFTNIVRDGNQALLDMLQAATRLGLVIDESLIRQSEKAKDQLTILATIIKVNFTRGLLSGFLEDFTDFAAIVEDPKFAASIRELGNAITDFVKFVIENRQEIVIAGAALAGLFTGAVFGPIGAFVGSLVAAGGAFVLLGDEIITVTEATERLDKALAKLALVNAKIESGFDILDPFKKGALFKQRRLLDEIAEVEEVIAAARQRRLAALPPPPGRTAGGLVIDIGPSAEQQARAVALFEATRTAAERYAAEQEELNALLDSGALKQDLFNRALDVARERFEAATVAENALSEADRRRTQEIKRQQLAQISASQTLAQLLNDLKFETSLIGKNNTEREIAITLRRAEAIAQRAGLELSGRFVRQITDEITKRAELRRAIEGTNEALGAGAASFTGTLKSKIIDTSRFMGFQGGGDPRTGFPFIAGEAGREIIVPRIPVTVIPAAQTRAAFGRSAVPAINITINAAGAQRGVGAEIRRVMDRFEASLPALISDVVGDDRARIGS